MHIVLVGFALGTISMNNSSRISPQSDPGDPQGLGLWLYSEISEPCADPQSYDTGFGVSSVQNSSPQSPSPSYLKAITLDPTL